MSERSNTCRWAVISLILVIACNCAFAGKTLYVDDDGPADFNNIQAAIDDSNDGDTVIISTGTYTGDGNRDINFKGKAITVRSSDPKDPAVVARTIIDFEARGRGFNFHSNEGPDSVLAGLTITNGAAKDGSGIFIRGSSPTVKHCNITGNSSDGERGFGGGFHIKDGFPVISHCTISDNSTDWNGGGIFCNDSSPIIINCTIIGNRAFNEGAGICCWDGSPLISNCVIKDNITTRRRAGGIACRRSNLTITNCIIADNIAGDTGGGIWLRGAGTKINQCTITGNSSEYMGGGVYFELGNATLVNCILENNDAPNGPEIGVNSWSGVITERRPYPAEPYPVSFLTISYSNVQGDQNEVYVYNQPGWFLLNWGLGNIDTDPLFTDPNNGDYHLKSQAGRWLENEGRWTKDDVTSPCIDTGDMSSPIGFEPFPNGGIINMGAYGGTAEASKSYFGQPLCEIIIAGDINGDCRVDFDDFVLMANHWLEYTAPACDLDHRPPGGGASMPNPAAVYCHALGYEHKIVTDDEGNQYGICIFPDGSECGSWDFYRGKCGQEWSYCKLHGYDLKDLGRYEGWFGGAICIDKTTGEKIGTVYDLVAEKFLSESFCETIIAGDINGDYKVDFADLAIMAAHWLEDNTPANSNCVVKDGVEYYLQTNKAIYRLGENVEILYRVTNLTRFPVDVGEILCGGEPHFAITDDDTDIWQYLRVILPCGFKMLHLGRFERKEFQKVWNMTNDNGTLWPDDDYPVGTGRYKVTGELELEGGYERVPLSVTIEIIP